MKKALLLIGISLITAGCQTTRTPKHAEPQIMMVLEENCKNDEFILVKDNFRRESDYKNSMTFGMPVMEDYACKHNTKMEEAYLDENRISRRRPVTSEDGKTYMRAQLEELANTNQNITIGRVTRRVERTIAPY